MTTTPRESSIWAVTATYNERENLGQLAEGMLALPFGVTTLIVDDDSPDGTGDLADGLAQSHPGRFAVIHRPGKLGYGSAHRLGIEYALDRGADIVITMDADLSHNPDRIPSMVDALADHDLVIGSRYAPGGGTANWGLDRRILSRGAGLMVRIASGMPYRDPTSGYRAYRADLLHRAHFEEALQEGYAFLYEMLFRCHRTGASITEVPIVFVDRRAGKSKMSKKIILESALRLLPIFWRRITGWRP
ncbi:MAG TPA: polyprenol monophosphomannose synthase [Armatimonadota bacterium]|nr:polyprenol monophosphomannose synthase [Armatimonadota bacterium]